MATKLLYIILIVGIYTICIAAAEEEINPNEVWRRYAFEGIFHRYPYTDGNSTCSSGEYPDDTNDDEDDQDRFCVGEDRISEEEQRSFCARLIDGSLSRLQALKVSRRMIELLQRPRISRPDCRISPTLNLAAQRLIEFMTGETYSFLSDDDMPPEQKRRKTMDSDYCELYTLPSPRRSASMDQMIKIVGWLDEGKSERFIQSRYSWYKRQYADRFRLCVETEGRMRDKLTRVHQYVEEKVKDSRNRLLPIHDHMLTEWGLEIARQLNITNFFKASPSWLLNFKKRAGITSRAITEYSSRAEQERAEEIEESTRVFKDDYTRQEF